MSDKRDRLVEEWKVYRAWNQDKSLEDVFIMFVIAREAKIASVLEASKAMVELIIKHREYEESKTLTLQKAANLAREGNQDEAKKILRQVDSQPRVFDYSKVNNDLIKAVKKVS